MSRIKRFIQTALTYLAGNIFSKLVTFFLIPLYTNRLSTTVYGNYDVVSSVVTLLVAVAFFQIWDGMFRMSFDYDKEQDKYAVIGICFKGYGIGIVLFSCLYFIICRLLSFDLIALPFIFGIAYGLQYMFSFATRIFLKNKLFVISGAANTLVIALTNIVLIVFFSIGVQSLFIAQIAGALIQIIIIELNLHLLPNIMGVKFEYDRFRKILRFSVPLCIATVSYWLLSGFTKIVINQVCGPADNGLFAIASSFSNVAVIAVNVFQFAWNETAYLMANEENRISTYKKSLDLLFSTVWICCAAFCSGISIIFPYYVGEAFQASSVVVPYLMIGVSANAIAGFLGTLFMTEQKTTFIMVSTFAAAAINMSLSNYATNRFGLFGAVIVLSLSFIVLMILRLIQIKRKLEITISREALISILPVIISVLLFIYQAGIGINVLFILILVFVYVLLFQDITGIRLKSIIQKPRKDE